MERRSIMLSGVRAYLSLPQMGCLYLVVMVQAHSLKKYSIVKTKEQIISIYSNRCLYAGEKLDEVEATKTVIFKKINHVIIRSAKL